MLFGSSLTEMKSSKTLLLLYVIIESSLLFESLRWATQLLFTLHFHFFFILKLGFFPPNFTSIDRVFLYDYTIPELGFSGFLQFFTKNICFYQEFDFNPRKNLVRFCLLLSKLLLIKKWFGVNDKDVLTSLRFHQKLLKVHTLHDSSSIFCFLAGSHFPTKVIELRTHCNKT